MQRLRGDAEGTDDEIPIVVVVLKRFMEDYVDTWQGRATDLLLALNATADSSERCQRGWPQNAKQLGHRLRNQASTLEHHGLYIERVTSGGRKLYVSYTPKELTESSTTGTGESENLTPTPPAPVITTEKARSFAIQDFRRSLH